MRKLQPCKLKAARVIAPQLLLPEAPINELELHPAKMHYAVAVRIFDLRDWATFILAQPLRTLSKLAAGSALLQGVGHEHNHWHAESFEDRKYARQGY